MGGYQIKANIFDDLRSEISNINQHLLDNLQGKKEILNTVEFIKINFSDNLMEDAELLNTLSGNSLFKVRHAHMIMRDMLEQVIEFIYLMKHPETIADYLGANVDTNSISDSDPIRGFHKLGNERYIDGRKSVSEMAKDIGEKKSSPACPALYEMYQLLSEECHNSYFFASLNDAEEAETGKEVLALTEDQAQNLMIIIGRFMEIYRK